MSRQVLTWSDWSGGDYGVLDPRRVPAGMFSGSNVVVFQDGSVGPRPGLRKCVLVGGQNGVVWGLHNQPVSGKELLVISDNDVFRGNVSVGPLTLTLTSVGVISGGAPTDFCVFDYYDPDTMIFFVSPGDQAYVVNLTAGTVSAIPSSPGGRTLKLWRDRLYIAGDPTSTPWRVKYSDAAAFTSGFGVNYIDVDYWYEAYVMETIRDRLFFGLQGNGWWTLTGPPDTGLLRSVYAHLVPDRQRACVQDDLQNVFYWPQTYANRGMIVTNGSVWDPNKFDHLRLTGGAVHGAFQYGTRDLLFISPGVSPEGYWRKTGVWTKQVFGVTLDGPITRWADTKFMLVGGANSTSPGVYYFLDATLDRPGFTTDTFAQPGDDSDIPLSAELTTPPIWSAKGLDMTPLGAYVDFVAYNWDSSGGGSCRIDLQYEVHDRYNSTTATSNAESWTEPTSSFDTAGVARRQRFGGTSTSKGGGVSVRLSNLQGVKIRSVQVLVEVSPDRMGP